VPIVRALALDQFATDHPRLTRAYLADQEARGCIRPDWRFAWVDADGRVGSRVVYWGRAGDAAPILVDVVAADAAGTVGEVLAGSLAELGVGAIEYLADRAAGAPRAAGVEPDALERVGFTAISTQTRFVHTGPVAVPPWPAGVEVRSVAELGYEPLVELIAAVQTGSDDRATRDRAAADELAALRGLDHDPAAWAFAVERSRAAPLGFVMPAITPDGGRVIAFIGVRPEARGRGVGRGLLAVGTAALRRTAPDASIRADVDDANPAMLRATAAVGYRAVAGRAHYRRVATGREPPPSGDSP